MENKIDEYVPISHHQKICYFAWIIKISFSSFFVLLCSVWKAFLRSTYLRNKTKKNTQGVQYCSLQVKKNCCSSFENEFSWQGKYKTWLLEALRGFFLCIFFVSRDEWILCNNMVTMMIWYFTVKCVKRRENVVFFC